MAFRLAFLIVFIASLGCGAGNASVPRAEITHAPCAVRLAGATAPLTTEAPAPSPAVPMSRLVVHAEAPLATLGERLEPRIPRRLAEGDVRIGPGGTVSYSVERGALSLSIARNTLIVEAPVHARAEACRGRNCYASCAPEATVRASVSLLLTPDYGFEPARVSLQFTRGCKIRALGGLLTLDVTPTLEAQLEPELAKVSAMIDRQLTSFRADTERLWGELVKVRALPLGGCLVLQPQGIVQGPLDDSKQQVHARFALLARPELRRDCPAASEATTVPPLARDLALRDHGQLLLGMSMPLEGLESSWSSASPGRVEDRELGVAHAKLTSLGSDVAAELELAGEVCGGVSLRASLGWTPDGTLVGLSKPRWLPGEAERALSQGVEPSTSLQVLAKMPRVAPLLTASAVQIAVPGLVSALSTKDIELGAEVLSARGATAFARGNELVAYLEVEGSLHVRAASAR